MENKIDVNGAITISNGLKIPVIGLGVFKSSGGEETVNAVRWAIEAGYRSIDTAMIYHNEESVGEGIRRSGVPRKDIFLCSKVWNADIKARRTREAFSESLERLGTDYLDSYLLHWPVDGFKEAWEELEKLYDEGRIKVIGVSNFNISHLEELYRSARIQPMINQIESHPYLVQKELLDYCQNRGIVCEVWSPLGGTGGNLLEDETILGLAGKYEKSPAQIVIRWDIQRQVVVIPKSVHKERIEQNLQVFDFELEEEDMRIIDSLNRDLRVGPDPQAMAEKWR
ncbi:aldo/keto reductase [Clostridium sp. AN503]|uniref:aldo/keto reductase n=1 Tax=Clostridium sp. AN503 TaxID=3160598 RepID=UPI003458999C